MISQTSYGTPTETPGLTKESANGLRSNYRDELTRAMTLLAQDERTIFLGQSVGYPGNARFDTLEGVPMEKRIELPVAEEMQMGMSIGLSLQGFIPVSIFPRFDFLLCAMNQLVNHLDRCEEMTNGEFKPKVIIRTCVGATYPLNPGTQHIQDYTLNMMGILNNTHVVDLYLKKDIVPTYTEALNSERSTLIVERAELYGMV